MKYIIVCACFVIGCSGDDLSTLGNATVSEAGGSFVADGEKTGSEKSDGGKQEDARADGETDTGIDDETGAASTFDGETGVPSDGAGEAGACHPSTTQVAAAPECAPAGGNTVPDHIEVVAVVNAGTGPANSCSWESVSMKCQCDYTCDLSSRVGQARARAEWSAGWRLSHADNARTHRSGLFDPWQETVEAPLPLLLPLLSRPHPRGMPRLGGRNSRGRLQRMRREGSCGNGCSVMRAPPPMLAPAPMR